MGIRDRLARVERSHARRERERGETAGENAGQQYHRWQREMDTVIDALARQGEKLEELVESDEEAANSMTRAELEHYLEPCPWFGHETLAERMARLDRDEEEMDVRDQRNRERHERWRREHRPDLPERTSLDDRIDELKEEMRELEEERRGIAAAELETVRERAAEDHHELLP